MNLHNNGIEEIDTLCEEAQEFEEMMIFDFALNKYNQALELIGNNDDLMEKKV